MSFEQKYFHDRLILVLLTVLAFLALLCAFLVLIRLDSGRNEGYIVEYRSNLLVSQYKNGTAMEILAFIPFSVIVLLASFFMSLKVHAINRQFAIVTLVLSIILLSLAIVVSNSLIIL